MFRLSIAKTVAIVATAFSLQASASAINLISNGSFEDVNAVTKSNPYKYNPQQTYAEAVSSGKNWGVFDTNILFDETTQKGWTALYGKQIEINVNGLANHVDTAFGKNYLELDTHFGLIEGTRVITNESNAGIAQKLTGLVVGQTYELSFWYRARTTLAQDNLLNVYWIPSTVDALTKGALNASAVMPLLNEFKVKTVDYSAAENNQKEWVKYTHKLVATYTEMTLGFGADGNAKWGATAYSDVLTPNGNKEGAKLDNVSLVAVPAPASIGLFGLGLLALGLRRRMSK